MSFLIKCNEDQKICSFVKRKNSNLQIRILFRSILELWLGRDKHIDQTLLHFGTCHIEERLIVPIFCLFYSRIKQSYFNDRYGVYSTVRNPQQPTCFYLEKNNQNRLINHPLLKYILYVFKSLIKCIRFLLIKLLSLLLLLLLQILMTQHQLARQAFVTIPVAIPAKTKISLCKVNSRAIARRDQCFFCVKCVHQFHRRCVLVF